MAGSQISCAAIGALGLQAILIDEALIGDASRLEVIFVRAIADLERDEIPAILRRLAPYLDRILAVLALEVVIAERELDRCVGR
jgi:hypothetical protein